MSKLFSSAFALNYKTFQEDVKVQAELSNRNFESIKTMLVTKNVSATSIEEAFNAGHRLFGENKVQELKQKSHALQHIPIQFHFIGHLQTNKVKECVQYANSIDSLDNPSLLYSLDRELSKQGRSLNVLVQVNTSNEQSKFGIEPEKLIGFLKEISNFETIKVKGLMTLAVLSNDSERVRACFRLLKKLQEQAQSESISGIEMSELSMGMSSDYKIAIEEGATILRIGTRIFGERK